MTAFWNVSFPNFKLEQYVLLRDTQVPSCLTPGHHCAQFCHPSGLGAQVLILLPRSSRGRRKIWNNIATHLGPQLDVLGLTAIWAGMDSTAGGSASGYRKVGRTEPSVRISTKSWEMARELLRFYPTGITPVHGFLARA